MPFDKKTVVKFDGLVNGIRSELIPDGAARDILNFRFEKLGKLVSRNGVLIGLFTIPNSEETTVTGDLGSNKFDEVLPSSRLQNKVYLHSAGIVGIGEFVLEAKWNAIDSDRLMVYAVKSELAAYPVAYLFSPLTGKYANRLLYHEGQTNSINGVAEAFNVLGRMDYVTVDTAKFQAPKRLNPTETYNSELAEVDYWIDQFVRMNQYRHKLIISDRINGDMMLVDDYNSQTDKVEAEKTHQIYFKPVKLQDFDIDDVEVDTGLDTYIGGDKGINLGAVNTGMGLYKFVLPKKQMIASEDNYSDYIGNQDKLFPTSIPWNEGKSLDARKSKQREIANYIVRKENTTFLSFYTFDDAVQVAYPDGVKQKNYDGTDTGEMPYYRHLTIANGTEDHPELEYIFTNGEENTEFSDIMGTPELEEVRGDEETEKSANVFVWNDFKIDYYASNGKEYTTDKDLRYYLKDIDRIFTKVSSGIPKITKLTVKDEKGRRVPLGVYRYRFVWDMGDGVYSAPSAELVVPDIMWSATPDSQMTNSGIDKYVRPRKITTTDIKKSLVQTSLDGTLIGEELEAFKFANYNTPNWTIKPEMESFWNLKKKLYSDTFRFGSQTNTFADFNALLMSDDVQAKKKQNFTTLITIDYGGSLVSLKGKVWDSVGVATNGGDGFQNIGATAAKEWVIGTQNPQQYTSKASTMPSGAFWSTMGSTRVYQGAGGIKVPIFQDGRDITLNSIFDSEGRYRPSITTVQPTWILPGMNYGVGNPSSWNGVPILGDSDNVSIFDGSPADPFFSVNHLKHSWRITSTERYQWSALATSLVASGVDTDIYFNYELNNYATLPFSTYLGGDSNNQTNNTKRVGTIFRAIKSGNDDLANFKSDIPNQVIDRILLKGVLELILQDTTDNFSIDTEYIDTMWAAQVYWNATFDKALSDGQISISPLYGRNHLKGVSRNYTKGIKLTNFIGFLNPTLNWKYYGGRVTKGGVVDEFSATSFGYPIPTRAVSTDSSNGVITDNYYSSWEEIRHYTASTIGASNALAPLFAHQTNPQDVAAVHLYTNSRFTSNFSKVKIAMYGTGSRLLALEQLTAYFPSSLLFKSPRIGFQIPADKVPNEAKKLLIFRTRASHENDYNPNKYGLVETVDISRVKDGIVGSVDNTVTSKKQVLGSDNKKKLVDVQALYFFDDVPDKKVDFGVQPNQYNGQTTQLKSAFNIALNERTYYANFKQKQDSIKPRNYPFPISTIPYTNELKSVQFFQVDSAEGFDYGEAPAYAIVYEDLAGQKSLPTYLANLSPSISAPTDPTKKRAVVLAYLPAGYDEEIKQLLIYRKDTGSVLYRYIGICKKEDEGIFIDSKLTPQGVLKSDANDYINYESGLMYSETYRPDWIKAENFVEVKSGDGKQITGLVSLAGNLVIFKETSMHRYAVQGTDDPLSRNDEIDPQVGCIAPNALINVSNLVYFLSWKGLMRYDNNRLEKIDGAFDEELQYILKNMHEQDVRYISLGYNPYYNEIYLNLPQVYNTSNNEVINEAQDTEQASQFFEQERSTTGHIYIINEEKKYITKFGYPSTVVYSDYISDMNVLRWQNNGRENLRMYYTNTLGEMRSADLFPSVFGHSNVYVPIDDTANKVWAGIYNETPYKERGEGLVRPEIYLDYDETLDPREFTQEPLTRAVTWDFDSTVVRPNRYIDTIAGVFPAVGKVPIANLYKSKYFAADDETIWKRLRKVVIDVFSRGKITLDIKPRTKDSANSYTQEADTSHTFEYSSTVNSVDLLKGEALIGTNSNILEAVPDSRQDSATRNKPLEVSLEISSSQRTEIKEISFYWKPIKTYLK